MPSCQVDEILPEHRDAWWRGEWKVPLRHTWWHWLSDWIKR